MKGLSHPSVTIKRNVIERDGGWCIYMLPGCQGEATTTDHRANRGAGGSRILNDPTNLCAICWSCNSRKADAVSLVLLELEQRGLWIRPDSTHERTLARAMRTPVEYPDGERYFLIDEHKRAPVTEVSRGGTDADPWD